MRSVLLRNAVNQKRLSITENEKIRTGLIWMITNGNSTVSADNIDYEFGHPVMPAKSAKKRIYMPYKYTHISEEKRKRSRKQRNLSSNPVRRYDSFRHTYKDIVDSVPDKS